MNGISNSSSSVFTTAVSKKTLEDMSKKKRIAFLEEAFGQEEGKLNFAKVIEDYVNGKDLNSIETQIASEIVKSHGRVAVMLKLLQNKEFICTVKDGEGNCIANRYLTHYGDKYIILDDTTGFKVLFSKRHYTYTVKDTDITLQNKTTGEELSIKGSELISDGISPELFTCTGSREADSLTFSWHNNDGSNEVRCKVINIKFVDIVWGMTHGYEVLNAFSIFGIELCDLHHIVDYENDRYRYRVEGGLHPDRVSNLKLMTKAEHRKYHKVEAEKARKKREIQKALEVERQRKLNWAKLTGNYSLIAYA